MRSPGGPRAYSPTGFAKANLHSRHPFKASPCISLCMFHDHVHGKSASVNEGALFRQNLGRTTALGCWTGWMENLAMKALKTSTLSSWRIQHKGNDNLVGMRHCGSTWSAELQTWCLVEATTVEYIFYSAKSESISAATVPVYGYQHTIARLEGLSKNLLGKASPHCILWAELSVALEKNTGWLESRKTFNLIFHTHD